MVAPEETYVLNEAIVFREEDDGAFLFNPESDTLHCLNEVGTSICKLCDGRHSLADISLWISRNYDARHHAESMQEEINSFIEKMIALNFLKVP